MDTNHDWELHAQNNPYWAVITWDKFKGDLEHNPKAFAEFFQTGHDHISNVFRIIEASVSANFSPVTALDFGCGVGRLMLPLVQKGLRTTGIDISPTMQAIAKKNLAAAGFRDCVVAASLEELPVEERFDFVHTFAVLQHIPTAVGTTLVASLLDRIAPGGVIALHLTYAPSSRRTAADRRRHHVHLVKSVVTRHSWVAALVKKLRGGKSVTPPMLMENYSLNEIFALLAARGMNNVHVRHSNHDDHLGLLILAQRLLTIPHPEPF